MAALVALAGAMLAGMSPATGAGSAADRLAARAGAPGASAWDISFASRLRLVAAQTAVTGAALDAGIEIALDPGWKTYWRNPGDSGIAPVFGFSGSENVAKVEVAYPMPARFDAPGDISFGYEERVIFPVTVTPADPAAPVTLAVDVNYGVCEELCIPVDASARLEWRSEAPASTAFAADLAAWRARVPVPGGLEVARLETVASGKEGYGTVLHLEVAASGPLADPRLIVEQTGGAARVYFGTPRMSADGARAVADIPVRALPASPGLEAGARLLITLADSGRAHTAIVDLPPSGR